MSLNDIEVENLTKVFRIYRSPSSRLIEFALADKIRFSRDFEAVKDVSFSVKKGTTLGLIGENGSGKSTLLQLICGILRPTNGTVRVNSRIGSLLELGAGFNIELSGMENITLIGRILGFSASEISEKTPDILSFADLGDFIDQPIKFYSSGMYVRLAFAINVMLDPEILILDEALAVGDAHFVHKCMLKISKLKEDGKTIILVSHDANSIRNMCDEVIWLHEGRIAALGNPTYVVDRYLRYVVGASGLPQKSQKASDQNIEIDRLDRSGNQRLQIANARLLSEVGNPISVVEANKPVELQIEFKNIDLAAPFELVVGYVIRSLKGIELASCNNIGEKTRLTLTAPEGSSHTCRVRFTIPFFHPGSYAISPAVSYIDYHGKPVIADRIENMIVFDLLVDRAVHVLMTLPSDFKLIE